ncbi:restriction endonuclease, SacI family [Yersinia aldovae]|uniref:SacI restriction endonuclease n=1 Tax=Yersinia aldovae TaxID=29483 RepID=A0ABP1YW25_YERAL|nr:restriction endonuclease, SacI family [Yersinia aldovae]CNL46873.1 SacI restriction endonuclease [Yersinia aldovae]
MKVSVDHKKAYEVILKAIAQAKKQTEPQTAHYSNISKVILGSHLTYRYILVTGLLAKATDNRVNPLVLQAKAAVDGAYDARSLCHSVIVGKVESEFLQGKLGASNEPFLNKPARFEIHSSKNAVRNGNDRLIQNISIDILKSASTQEIAFSMLVDAMHLTLQRSNRFMTVKAGYYFDFTKFMYDILEQPCDGESCAIISALSLLILAEDNKWKVKIHPVNQAGSSSKEILDIDVYKDSKPILSIEVKDKRFSLHDVHHAVNKARSAEVNNVIFIKGPRADFKDFLESDAVREARELGVFLSFINVTSFASTCYSLSGCINSDNLIHYINGILKSIRAKDKTVAHVSAYFK